MHAMQNRRIYQRIRERLPSPGTAGALAVVLTALILLLPTHANPASAHQWPNTGFGADTVPLPPSLAGFPPAAVDLTPGEAPDILVDYTVSLPVTVTVVTPPDLVPAILCATWEDIDSGDYTLTCAIVNDSEGTAGPSTAQLSRNGAVVWTETVPALGPGQSCSFPVESYTLSGDFDAFSLVADVNEEVDWEIADNNTAAISVSTPQEKTLSLALTAGWNLVSVPLLENASPNVVFPGVEAVYEWNPRDMSYSPPTTIDHTRSYWVAVAEDTTLPDIQGLALTSYVVELAPGWHMLGSVWLDGEGISRLACAPPLALQLPAFGMTEGQESYHLTTGVETGAGFWLAVREPCLVQVS
jgi:hypothetical protein